MINLFEKCPACGGQIVVTECKCVNCQLQMHGEFRTGQFASLSEDQQTFVKVFLTARGNLSEVEKVLGVSYPTIRNKLDEINDTLNRTLSTFDARSINRDDASAAMPKSEDETRRAILQKVAAGELSAADAVQKLQNLKGEK
jgi:hypothetical protein